MCLKKNYIQIHSKLMFNLIFIVRLPCFVSILPHVVIVYFHSSCAEQFSLWSELVLSGCGFDFVSWIHKSLLHHSRLKWHMGGTTASNLQLESHPLHSNRPHRLTCQPDHQTWSWFKPKQSMNKMLQTLTLPSSA